MIVAAAETGLVTSIGESAERALNPSTTPTT
jgi:hypothetical protein